ncbi:MULTISPECIES: hypothetical protein [Microbulbifer]|nr:hypothetical protein [Microbulbifer flavimaris]
MTVTVVLPTRPVIVTSTGIETAAMGVGQNRKQAEKQKARHNLPKNIRLKYLWILPPKSRRSQRCASHFSEIFRAWSASGHPCLPTIQTKEPPTETIKRSRLIDLHYHDNFDLISKRGTCHRKTLVPRGSDRILRHLKPLFPHETSRPGAASRRELLST